MNWTRSLIPALALAAAACSSDTIVAPAELPCVPGEAATCACSDGRSGSQICGDDGETFGKCQCTGYLPGQTTATGGGGGAGPTSTHASTTTTSSASTASVGGGGATSSAGGGGASSGGGGGGSTTTSTSASSSAHASSSSSGGVTNGPSSSSAGTGGAGGAGEGGAGVGGGTGGQGGAPTGPLGPWARSLGFVAQTEVESVVADGEGGVVVAGRFGGDLRLGAKSYSCDVASNGVAQTCAWVARFDRFGNVLWSHIVQDHGGDVRLGFVALGPAGEAVLAASYAGIVDAGLGPFTGSGVYVTAFTSSGAQRWVVHYTTPANDVPDLRGLAVDPTGRIGLLTVGTSVDYGDGVRTGNAQIGVLDDLGVLVWERPYALAATFGAFALTVSSVGDWTWLGRLGVGLDVGCGAISGAGDTFVATLDASGTCRRSRALGALGNGVMAEDPADDSKVITGHTQGSIDAGTAVLSGNGSFVVRIDADLAPIDGRMFAGNTASSAVAVDASTGDIAIGGNLNGPIDFGGGTLQSPGYVFFARFGGDLSSKASARFGDAHGGGTAALAFGADDELFLGGNFAGTLNFDNGVVIQAANSFYGDGFLAKLVP